SVEKLLGHGSWASHAFTVESTPQLERWQWLEMKFEAEADSLGPKFCVLQQNRWPRRAGQGADTLDGGNLRWVYRTVDHVTGSDDVTPIQEVVTHEDAQVVRYLVAHVDPQLGNDAESIPAKMAAVGGQRQDARGRGHGDAAGRRDDGAAVNVDFLMCGAER